MAALELVRACGPGAAVATIWKKPPSSREFCDGGDLGRDPLVVDERAIEARRLAAGEHLGDEIQFGVAVREQRRRVPGEVEPRQLDAILEHAAAPRAAGGRRGDLDRRRLASPGIDQPK